jgi:uncharacterized protein (DUF433 family)
MGLTPDLGAIQTPERLRAKMVRLVVESDLLGGRSREEMLADYRRLMAAAIKGKLETTRN